MPHEHPKPKRANLARRERLHPDWPMQVLSFPAWIIGQPPQALWDNARLMNQLWNDLCALFEQAEALDAKDEAHQPVLAKEKRRAIWFPFGQRKTVRTEKNAETYDLCQSLYGVVPSLETIAKNYKGLMPSVYYETVVARFIVTVKEWQKAPHVKGAPRLKHGIHRINLPVMFNEGTTLERLREATHASLRYTEPLKNIQNDEYHNNAHICVGIERVPIPLHVAFTRPMRGSAFRANHANKAIPDEHRIKRVSLCGKFSRALGWTWSYQIQIERAFSDSPRPATGRGCGLDVGWRMREDGLRIACLVDTEEQTLELVLPFEMRNRDECRNLKRFGGTGKINDWRNLPAMAAACDEAKEECKKRIREIYQVEKWQGDAQAVMNGFEKLGRRGLSKLLEVLPEHSAAIPVIHAWLEQNCCLQRSYRGTEAVLNRTWMDLRKKLAAWIASEFDEIVIKGDLKLKQLAEVHLSAYDGGLNEGRKWRQRASLHEFLRWIELQAKKQQATITKDQAKGTTGVCYICGAPVKKSGKLVLVCEKGHKFDQDVNAGFNLRNQLRMSATFPMRPMRIPCELQRYVRVVPLSD